LLADERIQAILLAEFAMGAGLAKTMRSPLIKPSVAQLVLLL